MKLLDTNKKLAKEAEFHLKQFEKRTGASV
jgi:hypothetical protein